MKFLITEKKYFLRCLDKSISNLENKRYQVMNLTQLIIIGSVKNLII